MRILLAIDDSKFSEAATQALVAQVRPEEAEVRVLHVIEPLPAVYGSIEGGYVMTTVTEEQRAEAESLVARTAKILRDVGFRATTPIEQGTAKSVIVDSATQWPAELIVVGSHGRKGIDRFLMGSVAEGVARHAPCSVQVVRIPTEAPTHLAANSNERGKDVSNPELKIETPIALVHEQRKQICNVCGKPSSSNICPVCADKIRAEALADATGEAPTARRKPGRRSAK
jgi:nucleotide-binding universal stress UspA family protein